jgi:hypothetical protein
MAARLRRTEAGSFACDALAHGSQLVVVRTRFEAPRPHTARLPARGLPALVVQLGGEQVYTGGGLVRPVAAGDVLFDDGRLPYRRLTLPGAVADATWRWRERAVVTRRRYVCCSRTCTDLTGAAAP